MATELILIRHGQASRTGGDYANAPLTALGVEQASLTGQYFRDVQAPLDGFYSSPLRRARDTAALIGDQIDRDTYLQNGLQEMEYSEFAPLVLLESLVRLGLFRDYLRKKVGKPLRWPLVGRVSTALTDLIAHHPDQSIALVTHGGVISGTLAWYMPEERRRWWRETVENCSLTRLKVNSTTAELLQFNDNRHLQPQAASVLPRVETDESENVAVQAPRAHTGNTLGRI